METLAAPPRARFVDPTQYDPFARFTCGMSTEYEREVNDIVQALYAGQVQLAVRVAEVDTTGELLGLCGFTNRALRLAPPHQPLLDAAYICVIAVPMSARGKYRLPGGMRIGDFLLTDALVEIRLAWGGALMPPVWALIDPANIASHRIFDNRGFGLIPADPNGKYDVRLRPRGLPLPEQRG